MPTLEEVLGTLDTLELTGAGGVCGGLTMGYNPVTRRRAFRLVVEDTIENTISLARIDDVRLDQLEVAGFDDEGCRGTIVCGVYTDNLGYEFADPDGLPGQTRTYAPLTHDDRAIERLIEDCNCTTANDKGRVRSMKFYFSVKFTERRAPPAGDRWARCQFTCCLDCEPRRT